MNSTEIFCSASSGMGGTGCDSESALDARFIPRVKELSERDRRYLLMHFLALDEADRLLRFGTALPDELIIRYVQRLDFSRDAVFGVYDSKFRLVGVGHLVFVPRETMPALAGGTLKERIAGFGLSVSRTARGLGIGSKLFHRATIHCRNADVDTLSMHCLASNQLIAHIAKKVGMLIYRDHDEAEACLKILPPRPASVLQQVAEEQVAALDYAIKTSNLGAARKWMGGF